MNYKARFFALLAATTLVACSQSGPGAVTPVADACLVLAPPDSGHDTVTVAIPEAVDLSHAPAPATEAERLVFGTFYESVTRVDCGGNVRPGLAKAWGTDFASQHWRFTLRSDIKFSDGTRLTSDDVVASLAPRLAPRDSIAAIDSFNFTVTLAVPDSDLPHRLADPALAVARPQAAGGVGAPLGTTAYRVSEWTAGRVAGVPVSGAIRDIVFRVSPGTDARDLLDQGADVVFTDSPAALEYARSRDTYVVAPLEWSWVYAFIGPALPTTRVFRDQFAAGAVRGDVQAAVPPFWWTDLPPCPRALPTSSSSNTAQRRIAYVESDPVARDVVGRVVALASSGQVLDGGEVRALPLPGAEFDAALAVHREYGFVATLPRHQYARCSPLPLGAVTALVDARTEVVMRRGAAGLAITWDGTPRLLVRQ